MTCMQYSRLRAFLAVVLIFLVTACSAKKKEQVSAPQKDTLELSIPQFNADSAYHYVKTQVDFGPRVPNSPAHDACGDYLIAELERFGAVVTVQKADFEAWDGKVLKARNIIGAYNTEKKNRVLLLAHWDSRPWSDNDPDPANHKTPVDAANDGASGVGVLMEIARQLQEQSPEIGVDILFVDMEDYGEPQWYNGFKSEDSWCLGSQYWSKNPHVPGYRANYGVLLDMVGAPGAVFPQEGYSLQYAGWIVRKIWSEAYKSGFDAYFLNKAGGYITDDHVPINQIAGIPTIDIIQFDENGFGHYWHTVNDNMTNIDKATLHAVGQTLLNVIYKEGK